MATTVLGTSTLPDPSRCTCRNQYIEARERDLLGAEHIDRFTYKRIWDVEWKLLDSTDWGTVNTEAVLAGSKAWTAPDGQTATGVTVATYAYDDVAIKGGPGYRVTMTLSEV